MGCKYDGTHSRWSYMETFMNDIQNVCSLSDYMMMGGKRTLHSSTRKKNVSYGVNS
jgi:hypothetical protein